MDHPKWTTLGKGHLLSFQKPCTLHPDLSILDHKTWTLKRERARGGAAHAQRVEPGTPNPREREFFIDNLLVRIHFIIEMILVDRPCAMGV